MKTLTDVRANFRFADLDPTGQNSLMPFIELVIAYRDGKAYKIENEELITEPGPIADIRFLLTEESLAGLINRLLDWQKILANRSEFVDFIRPAVESIIHKPADPEQGQTSPS
jgi:hypothetical protein